MLQTSLGIDPVMPNVTKTEPPVAKSDAPKAEKTDAPKAEKSDAPAANNGVVGADKPL